MAERPQRTGVILTDRLELRPMTPAFLRASLAGEVTRAEAELGASLPDLWPDVADVLRMRLAQLEADPHLQPWLLRAMCHREAQAMVGHIGLHSAPGAEYLQEVAPGGVEFGFSVFPEYRRQGYAEEAARALMLWAFETHGVGRFVLSIAPSNGASQALARKLGFIRIGSHVDEVDGIEDVLLLDRA